MKTKIYVATFIGKTSMGYETGKTYEIMVQQQSLYRQWRRKWIVEIWMRNGMGWCPYGSIHSFLKNWQILPDQKPVWKKGDLTQ